MPVQLQPQMKPVMQVVLAQQATLVAVQMMPVHQPQQ
jgi:hypothetical protein